MQSKLAKLALAGVLASSGCNGGSGAPKQGILDSGETQETLPLSGIVRGYAVDPTLPKLYLNLDVPLNGPGSKGFGARNQDLDPEQWPGDTAKISLGLDDFSELYFPIPLSIGDRVDFEVTSNDFYKKLDTLSIDFHLDKEPTVKVRGPFYHFRQRGIEGQIKFYRRGRVF